MNPTGFHESMIFKGMSYHFATGIICPQTAGLWPFQGQGSEHFFNQPITNPSNQPNPQQPTNNPTTQPTQPTNPTHNNQPTNCYPTHWLLLNLLTIFHTGLSTQELMESVKVSDDEASRWMETGRLSSLDGLTCLPSIFFLFSGVNSRCENL